MRNAAYLIPTCTLAAGLAVGWVAAATTGEPEPGQARQEAAQVATEARPSISPFSTHMPAQASPSLSPSSTRSRETTPIRVLLPEETELPPRVQARLAAYEQERAELTDQLTRLEQGKTRLLAERALQFDVASLRQRRLQNEVAELDRQRRMEEARLRSKICELEAELDHLSPNWRQKATPQDPIQLLDRPVVLNFRKTPIDEVLAFLRDVSGLPFARAPGLIAQELEVTLRVTRVPLRDGLDLIAQTRDPPLIWTVESGGIQFR